VLVDEYDPAKFLAAATALRSEMTIKFMLLVNKQGQTRMAKYFTEHLSTEERRALEGEVVRKCLSRTDKQVGPQAGLVHFTFLGCCSGLVKTLVIGMHMSFLYAVFLL
jgi:Flp pilus assembly protein TadB